MCLLALACLTPSFVTLPRQVMFGVGWLAGYYFTRSQHKSDLSLAVSRTYAQQVSTRCTVPHVAWCNPVLHLHVRQGRAGSMYTEGSRRSYWRSPTFAGSGQRPHRAQLQCRGAQHHQVHQPAGQAGEGAWMERQIYYNDVCYCQPSNCDTRWWQHDGGSTRWSSSARLVSGGAS